jgi:hypothetical protein
MAVSRITKNLGFSVPPRMAEEFELVAVEEGSTKSELFRRMFRLYQSYRTSLAGRGQSTEAWVERIILEAREAEQGKPLNAEEFAQETDALREYGAKRARALGIASEEDVDQLVYAKRHQAR